MVGIYSILSPTGAYYFGQSWDIERRFQSYRRLDCKGQAGLYNSLVKHGVEKHVFSIMHGIPEIETQEHLDWWETYCISSFKSMGAKMLNIKGGGSSGKHSEESKKKISETLTGIKRSEDFRKKASQRMMGYKMSAATRLKLSESKKGITSNMMGKKHTDEARAKIRAKRKVQIITLEHRMKISIANKGLRGKAVGQYSKVGVLIKEWPSVTEAANALKMHIESVGNAARGKTKTAGGFIWKYKSMSA